MLNYQIALTNVPFDRSYMNVIRFSSRADQQEYFGVSTLFASAPSCNLKAGTLLTTQITVEAAAYNLQPMMNYNYCIVKDNTAAATFPYLYYFVLAIRHVSGAVLQVDVELDVMQTYYIDLTFSDCMIRRAHLNRWSSAIPEVSFDNSVDSALLNNDGVTVAKRLKKRTKISFHPDLSENSDFNEMLDYFQPFWVYIYISQEGAATLFGDELTAWAYRLVVSEMNTGVCCLVAPLFYSYPDNWTGDTIRHGITVRFTGSGQYNWNFHDLLMVLESKSLLPYIYNIKVSPKSPFQAKEYSEGVDYKNNQTTGQPAPLIEILSPSAFGLYPIHMQSTGEWVYDTYICFVTKQTNEPEKASYTISKETTFFKSDIVGKFEDIKYNPKLLSSDVYEVRIVDYQGNYFSYDPQKLNRQEITLLLSEPLTSAAASGYVRIQDIEGSAFDNGAQNAFIGLVYSNDVSIPFSVDQLSSFLSQNKNFMAIQQSQRDYVSEVTDIDISHRNASAVLSLAKGVGTGLGKAAGGDLVGGLGGVADSLLSFANSQIDNSALLAKANATNELSAINQAYTLDNMKSAPSSLKNAQGNVFLGMQASNEGGPYLYVEEYEAVEQDLYKLNDFYSMFGFKYERRGNIKGFDNVRYYHNYIQADLENVNINGNLSNLVREKIRAIFSTGVRFWNYHPGINISFSYNMENYENALAN